MTLSQHDHSGQVQRVQRAQFAARYQTQAPRLPEGKLDLSTLWPLAPEQRLELDLGFGRGLSLITRVEHCPQACIIGIESKAKWTCKVHQQLENRGLHKQARVFCEDMRLFLARCEPANSVHSVSLHFPDPWWKKRHSGRRVIDDSLIQQIVRLLRPEGTLLIQTDVEERALMYLSVLQSNPYLAPYSNNFFVDVNPLHAVSNRERRATEDGLPIWRLHAIKKASELNKNQPEA